MVNAEKVTTRDRGTQKIHGELIFKHMWKLTFSAHLDLKIEWREVDTEAIAVPLRWGKRMETQSH